jgi:hypothetical protein
MPNSSGTNYTTQELINIQKMNNFLNPPKGSMDGPTYASLKAQRAQQWANFVRNAGR